MKKIIAIAVTLVVVVALILAIPTKVDADNSDFLRVHIRADSNSNVDQSVKYKVKNAVVDYLVPYLSVAETKEQALAIVNNHLNSICAVADKVLSENGFSYTSSASVKKEDFPTRTYDGVTLLGGVYDALIINLGSGSGNNWWCVVYPPLCFVGTESNGTNTIIYKSKIQQIIENWKNSK